MYVCYTCMLMFVSHIVIYEWFALQISWNPKSLFLDLISRFEASRLGPHADQGAARAFSTVSKCRRPQMTVPGKGADCDMRVLRHDSVLATSSSHSHPLVVLLLISLGLSLSPYVLFVFLSLSLCLYLLLLFLPLSVPLSLARLFSLTFLFSPLFLSWRTMLRLVLKA